MRNSMQLQGFPRDRARPQRWVLAVSTLLLVLLLPSAAHAWWNDDWPYRKKITIDASPHGVPLGEDPGRMPLLVRLHDGNFKFDDAKDDGSDLRFVAADDKTPLKFHIERFDAVFGLAFIWVDVPGVRNGVANDIWMYYGNGKAQPGDDPRGTYDGDQVLVYHFGEKEGPPRDQTGYKNDAQSPGRTDDGSLIGGGLKFDGSTLVTLPASPSLAIAEGGAMTWSGWIKADAEQENGIIFARHDGDKSLVIGLAQGAPYVAVSDGAATARSEPGQALAAATWHHIAVVASDHIALFVDGKAGASVAAHLPALASAATLGGDGAPGSPALAGSFDELEISKIARGPGFIAAAAATQGPEGRLVTYGEDEQTATWTSGYFAVILKSVTLDGWVVIGILMVMAVVSWTLMVAKARQLGRVGRANARFIHAFRGVGHDPAAFEDVCRGSLCEGLSARERRLVERSPLYRVYALGAKQLSYRFDGRNGGRALPRALSAQSITAIRAVLDSGVVREMQSLNRLMVLLTIAISGGPFLGLLGTVVGVMITFAAIALQGDVNINAIAPGIAAALVATVAGLGVAIPALFGYNYLITQIKDASADMQVFVDEFVTRMAEHYDPLAAPRELAAE